ncbi:hsp70 family chaperone [Colletotrichum karsti]|uniref:Hsp70 family chaperone n=1 Tax=Colletotrichum karsti TaxID=1095194 RepID=A0A9P6IGQ0_9PEZI|nr:hsp70 family chaperone [Colletotrichum karsti]KAF9880281.1 hsp70 family chaperone [Colletotrichum karsti]
MSDKPDVLVSIDLGTTFTGVAWMTPKTPIQVINDWPGSGDRGERKVPTVLTYNADGSLSKWGFMCGDEEESMAGKLRREFFKIFIDEDTLEAWQQRGLPNAPRNVAEAERLVTDFLREVFDHVKESIETQLGRRHTGGWTDMAVTFLFSVPTTWTKMETINSFKRIIHDAGFGAEGARHFAQVDLTEAEAAAVATLKTSAVNFQMGSLFLTVDAGGGTTDLAVMQITSTDTQYPQMSQISEVKGVGIGASLIDVAFIHLVNKRLADHPEVGHLLPRDFAFRMSRSHHFKTVKHKFGERAYMQPVFKMQLEGVSHDFNHEGLRIVDGRMLFTMQEIQVLFDVQIDGIMRCIEEQLDRLIQKQQPQAIEYMVLSGGLGGSAYVRDSLQAQFQNYAHQNAEKVAVIPCQDPQLVVVRGLLLDHQQKMETGRLSVLATRIARASYGVVIKEVYSPQQHFNEDIQDDAFDPKKKWAVNQIRWLIKKGDTVNPNSPLVHSLAISLGAGDTRRSWDANIVISHNEASFLPKSLKHAGATKLCDVKSNLTGVQQDQLVLKHKRGSCFSKGTTYYILNFDVRVIIAPADIRFELWFGGQKFSGNHEPIAVMWDEKGVKANGSS